MSDHLLARQGSSERSLALGCCGDVAQELGPALAGHVNTLLPWAIAALVDDEVVFF